MFLYLHKGTFDIYQWISLSNRSSGPAQASVGRWQPVAVTRPDSTSFCEASFFLWGQPHSVKPASLYETDLIMWGQPHSVRTASLCEDGLICEDNLILWGQTRVFKARLYSICEAVNLWRLASTPSALLFQKVAGDFQTFALTKPRSHGSRQAYIGSLLFGVFHRFLFSRLEEDFPEFWWTGK